MLLMNMRRLLRRSRFPRLQEHTYRIKLFHVNKELYATFMIITGTQIRAARCLLGWKQTDLAEASRISEISIKNIERGATDPRASTLTAIKQAFEYAGLIFLEPGDTRDGSYGIRLKKEPDTGP